MSRRAIVLRPQPGADRTAKRLSVLGVTVEVCPLFTVVPLAWQPPDPDGFDALLLTSANAAQLAGPSLNSLRRLPVLAVGEATAAAAREAGLSVALTGASDAAALVASARSSGFRHPLHLAGRDRIVLPNVRAITVYASERIAIGSATVRGWGGQLALLHSPRAARRFAALIDENDVERAGIAVAALSRAVADAAGGGWATQVAADEPTDAALTTLARELIDPPGRATDKRVA